MIAAYSLQWPAGWPRTQASGHKHGKRTWREVMTFGESTPTADQLRKRYRELANRRHPDKPSGSHAAMAELNAAYEEAKKEIGARTGALLGMVRLSHHACEN